MKRSQDFVQVSRSSDLIQMNARLDEALIACLTTLPKLGSIEPGLKLT